MVLYRLLHNNVQASDPKKRVSISGRSVLFKPLNLMYDVMLHYGFTHCHATLHRYWKANWAASPTFVGEMATFCILPSFRISKQHFGFGLRCALLWRCPSSQVGLYNSRCQREQQEQRAVAWHLEVRKLHEALTAAFRLPTVTDPLAWPVYTKQALVSTAEVNFSGIWHGVNEEGPN